MKPFKIIFFITIAITIIISGCSKDESAKPDIFIYGLLGVSPDSENPEEDYQWIYARVFNHPDNQSVEAELTKGTQVIPLEANYGEANKYFTEGRAGFSFEPFDEYQLRIWDSKNTFSGKITTLMRLNITEASVTGNQVDLEWTDIGADFYDVGFSHSDFEQHYQVEDDHITVDLSELDLGDDTWINIGVAGFNGFSPISDPGCNMTGCNGYLFGYSRNNTTLDLQTMTFSKEGTVNSQPNLDNLILAFHSNSSNDTPKSSSLKFMFTYATLYNASYDPSGYNYFSGTTVTEPANALKAFEGYLDGEKLTSYTWGGFFHGLYSYASVYGEYNNYMQCTFTLQINDKIESASVANPDTFSIVSPPSSGLIPMSPFQITWDRSDNADYFFINASWIITGDDIGKNYFYSTENNAYLISDIPTNAEWGRIDVVAINGPSPMHSLEPNLEKLNGFYFSRRYSINSVIFSDNIGKGVTEEPGVLKEDHNAIDLRVDQFLLNKLSEKHPELNQHKETIIRKIREQ